MVWSKRAPDLLGSVLLPPSLPLVCRDALGAQGEAPRSGPGVAYHLPQRRGVAATACRRNAAATVSKCRRLPSIRTACPWMSRIRISRQSLSVAAEHRADRTLRHPEGMPNRRVSIRFSSLSVVNGLEAVISCR